MPLLYGRIIRTEIGDGGLVIEALRQTLSLDRSDDPTQDRGILDVSGLAARRTEGSPERPGQISVPAQIREGRPIVVSAGYRGEGTDERPETFGVIFEGTIKRAFTFREELALKTRITLGDVAHSRDRRGTTNTPYERGTSIRQIARDIVERDMGLAVGPLDAIPEDAVFPRDFYWGGQPSAGALDALLRSVFNTHGFRMTWHETDGLVRFTRPGAGGVQADGPTIRITPRTGLIGTPEPIEGEDGGDDSGGYEVRSFLNPAIALGCIVDVASESLGSFRLKVKTITHEADNWDGPFETRLQGEVL